VAATFDFCSTTDVDTRLTAAGLLYAADPTGSGSITDPKVVANRRYGLDRANSDINQALSTTLNPGSLPLSQDDAARNETLRWLAADLASFYVAEIGGEGVPQTIKDAFDRAQKRLAQMEKREWRSLGLSYPGDGFLPLRRGLGRPRVARGGC
jgi:hypothetical protein